ncbi:IS200/IS605 family transposase [Desulfofundulus thermocisternus]|uniref:IS200/IS605 family transposase n=1 Tax=Desulfofundulus thermocisternus TaxID=42471 RepID=UPI00217E77CC|nr:IS200/IS605 family transposase [Desulfofundulus thermocisternus]MCS5696927.1 IS200/IS605 family transposase [Desulfofundulus thermocisternus]
MNGKTNHCVYNINYHIVFCSKYRHKVITGRVEDTVKLTIQETCNAYGYTLIQIETMPDHLHIFLSAPPTVAPTGICPETQKHHRQQNILCLSRP